MDILNTQKIIDSNFWRTIAGSIVIIIGLLLRYISSSVQDFVEDNCISNSGVYCFLAEFAFFDIGLNSIALMLIGIGSFLLVLYGFVAELLSYILSYALGHVSNASKIVISAMENDRMSREEAGEVIARSIGRYKGRFDFYSESIGSFIVENIVRQNHKDRGFWRKNFMCLIRIESLAEHPSNVDLQKYLYWIETDTFSIANSSKPHEELLYNYSSSSSIEIDIEDVEKLLSYIKYDVRAGGEKIFSLSDHIDNIPPIDGKNHFEYFGDTFSIKYKDGSLFISINKEIKVEGEELDFIVDEESFIKFDDDIYQLAIMEPTKGVRLRLRVPTGFKLVHRGMSGRGYGSKRFEDVSEDGDARNAHLDNPHWCFPGIVAVLAWKPDAAGQNYILQDGKAAAPMHSVD